MKCGAALSSCDYYPEDSKMLSHLERAGDPVLLFCLAPHGVFRAPSLTLGAVGSYPAFSPFPADFHPQVVYFL